MFAPFRAFARVAGTARPWAIMSWVPGLGLLDHPANLLITTKPWLTRGIRSQPGPKAPTEVSLETGTASELPSLGASEAADFRPPQVRKFEEEKRLHSRDARWSKFYFEDLKEEKFRDMFYDHRFQLADKALPDQELVDDRFCGVKDEDRPLVLVFGFAGASDSLLAKYAYIYRKAGCFTFCYNLPTRFIFETPQNIPYVGRKIVEDLESGGLSHRPMLMHLMSDTGLLVRQGINIILREDGKSNLLDIRGSVYDSCPSKRPEADPKTILAYMFSHWICMRRDKDSLTEALKYQMKFCKDWIWPAVVQKLKGLPTELVEMDSTFVGDTIRFELDKKWSELFLYSKADMYTNWKYLEKEVIGLHTGVGRKVHVQRFDTSNHVGHYKKYRKPYEEAVFNFLHEAYFSKLPKTCPKP